MAAAAASAIRGDRECGGIHVLTQIPKLEPQIPPIPQILRKLLGDDHTNLFVGKLRGVTGRNLLYLRNLWLNPFSVFGFNKGEDTDAATAEPRAGRVKLWPVTSRTHHSQD